MPYRKGLVLTYGILNCIVSLDGAVEKETGFVSVCTGESEGKEHPPTPISQKKHCASCNDAVIPMNTLKKAQVIGGDQYILMDAEEVEGAKEATLGATKKMLALTPHPAEDVVANTLQGSSVYFLAPEGASQIGTYSLLVDAITRHPEVKFLTLWTPTSKPSLFELKVYKNALVLEQRVWPEQVKTVPDVTIDVLEEHQAQLDQIVPASVKPFDAADYRDVTGEALAALLASKDTVEGIAAEKASKSGPRPASTGSVDLTGALSAMLASVAPVEEKKAKKSA